MEQGREIAEVGPGTSGFASFAQALFQSKQQEQQQQGLRAVAAQYLESSSSDRGSSPDSSRSPSPASRDRGGNRKKKRKREGSKERSKGEDERAKILRLELQHARTAGVKHRGGHKPVLGSGSTQPWAAPGARGSVKGEPPAYYLDTQPDRQSWTFRGLYAGDKAVFARKDPFHVAPALKAARWHGSGGPGAGGSAAEQPGPSGERYFHTIRVMAERSRRLRRLRLGRPLAALAAGQGSSRPGRGALRRALPLPEVIHLGPPVSAAAAASSSLPTAFGQGGGLLAAAPPAGQSAAAALRAEALEKEQEGESGEEYALRMTKEFNMATRESPEDVLLWLRFAAFQDTAAGLMGRV